MFVNDFVNYFTGIETHRRESKRRAKIEELYLDPKERTRAKFYSWCNEAFQISVGRVIPNIISFGGLIAFKDEPFLAAYSFGLGELMRNTISSNEDTHVEVIDPKDIDLETKEEKLRKAIRGKLSFINKEEFEEIL
ncbi:hypothetical protein HY837_00195 [archaeon]|nr:hypothetical protein [archaeon]